MIRIALLIALVIAGSTSASGQTPSLTVAVSGATLTLSPTAAQVAALQFVVDAYNANERAGMPAWTINQWIRSILIDRVQSAVEVHRAAEAKSACATFTNLSAADQKIILDKLAGKAPCAS